MDEKEACESFLIGGTGSGEKLGLALVGRAMLSKSLIQLSVDGWGCVPSQLFGLMVTSSRRTYDNMLHLLGMLLPVP